MYTHLLVVSLHVQHVFCLVLWGIGPNPGIRVLVYQTQLPVMSVTIPFLVICISRVHDTQRGHSNNVFGLRVSFILRYS